MGCRTSDYDLQTVPVRNLMVRVFRERRRPPGIAAWNSVLQALNLIPEEHLRLLGDFGYIVLCKEGCPPSSGGGNNPTVPYVRLSRACLSEDHNRSYNTTLLHEYGHIVDARYGAMDWLQANAPADFRLLASTGHRGTTQGPGERFADCYMLYLMHVVAGERTRHPADPAAYQGTQASERYRILLSTPAFSGISTPAPIAGGVSGAAATDGP